MSLPLTLQGVTIKLKYIPIGLVPGVSHPPSWYLMFALVVICYQRPGGLWLWQANKSSSNNSFLHFLSLRLCCQRRSYRPAQLSNEIWLRFHQTFKLTELRWQEVLEGGVTEWQEARPGRDLCGDLQLSSPASSPSFGQWRADCQTGRVELAPTYGGYYYYYY